MSYLLDTCSLSEFVVPKPDPKAVNALTALPREEIYVSAITLGELEQGVSELRPGPRKAFLRRWLDEHVFTLYAERTIPVETTVAREWGILNARLKEQGSKLQFKDSLIAATALVHGLTVVTRNQTDFAAAGVSIFNPWK